MHFSYREWNGVSETGVNAEARAGQKLCSGFSEKKVNRIDAYKTIAAEDEIERSCKRRITFIWTNGKQWQVFHRPYKCRLVYEIYFRMKSVSLDRMNWKWKLPNQNHFIYINTKYWDNITVMLWKRSADLLFDAPGLLSENVVIARSTLRIQSLKYRYHALWPRLFLTGSSHRWLA